MKKSTFRWGWLVAVFAMTALACTCGAVGQAQQAVETAQALATEAQALATQAQQFATQAEVLATQLEQSGVDETAQAQGTESGGGEDLTFGEVPEDIPVYAEHETLVSIAGSVSYFTSASYQDVVNFYKQEMPNKGWSEAAGSVEAPDAGSAVLNYEKDGRKATVSIASGGGQTTVSVVIEGN